VTGTCPSAWASAECATAAEGYKRPRISPRKRQFSADGSRVLWFEDEDGKKIEMYPDGRWYIADRNEADARAKMLIYIIENELITP
jgi:hypothetical protein